jgi:hypothetical protein
VKKACVTTGGDLYLRLCWRPLVPCTHRLPRPKEECCYEDWAFKAEYDFADQEVTLADVYLQYLGFDPLVITAGPFQATLLARQYH